MEGWSQDGGLGLGWSVGARMGGWIQYEELKPGCRVTAVWAVESRM